MFGEVSCVYSDFIKRYNITQIYIIFRVQLKVLKQLVRGISSIS